MFQSNFHAFYYICLFIAAVLSIFLFKNTLKPFKYLGILIILVLFVEIFAQYFTILFSTSNSAIYHIFTPIEFLFYTCIYILFINNKTWSKMLIACWLVLVLAEILNTVFVQPLSVSNTNIMIMESVFLIFYSLVLFMKIKESLEFDNLLKEGVFWFNSVVLVYYATNILIWGFHSIKIYNFTNPPTIIYDTNLIFSGVLYLIFGLAIYLNYKSINTTTNKIIL